MFFADMQWQISTKVDGMFCVPCVVSLPTSAIQTWIEGAAMPAHTGADACSKGPHWSKVEFTDTPEASNLASSQTFAALSATTVRFSAACWQQDF